MDRHLPSLVFDRVTFRRGSRVILDDVSLTVSAGETVAIIGPSGAGKTTMFRLALGFLRPDSGRLWVAGREISQLNERALIQVRRSVGIVFQDGALFTWMDVADNVAFGLADERLSETEINARVLKTLDSVGLADLADRMPDELSGGQAQRVAVARAIITQPLVMLYDEPTQGLDPQRALDVSHQIVRLASQGVASVAVTHQLEYAMTYSRRVALLEEGHIAYDGPFDGLRRVDDAFVRSFFEVLEGEHQCGVSAPPTVH